MTEQSLAYQCPNCGAGLAFDAEKQLFCCEFCLSELTREETLAANSDEAKREAESAREEYNSKMNSYRCSNCGAEILADEHTAAGSCCYCHNPVVLVGRLTGEMRPQRVVPFKYDKEEAKKIFLRFAKKKWFVPNNFYSAEQIENLTGIYYPFWITDADSDSGIEAHATKTRVWRRGNVQYTETSNFKVVRSGSIHFEDITTSAFSEADKKMLEGVLPYPSEALQEFSMPYLSGFVAKKRNLEREQVNAEVKARMEGYSEQLLRATVQGYNTVSVNEKHLKVHKSRWEYSLLPIWMLTYQANNGKTYTYAMNGHTGKVYGELPVSWWKLGILFGISAVLLTALFAGLGGLMLL